MAIGPEVVFSALQKLVSDAELKLDERIREAASKATFTGNLTVEGKDIPSEVLPILKQKYITAGWRGMSRADYGTSITFSFTIDNQRLLSENVQIVTALSPEQAQAGRRRITIPNDNDHQ